MQDEQTRKTVLAAIAAIAPDADLGRLRADQPLRRQIDLDSMDWLNVVAELNARLSLDIPESDYGRLTTLDAILDYAATHRAEGAASHPPAARAAAGSAGAASLPPPTAHVVNGTAVTVRPIRRDDRALEAAFVRALSEEARYERFMVAVSELPADKLDSLTDVDQVRHVALAATVQRDGAEAFVGVVRYAVEPPGDRCEFAVAVDDAWQGTGLAGLLMRALIDIARARGLATMEGIVLTTNARMLKFARQLGFRSVREPGDRETVRVERAL